MLRDASGRRNLRPGLLVTLAFLFVVAVAVRLPAADGRPLWFDELWRADLMLDPGYWHAYFSAPSVETAITSPLYAAFIKLIAAFSMDPLTLRLSSFLPGTFSSLAAFALVRRAGGNSALALLAGLVIALNTRFVDYSNEMKPYMLEVAIHLLALYAWLLVIKPRSPSVSKWIIFFAVLGAAILSTPTAVFLLPAAGFSLLVKFRAERDFRNLKVCVAGFAGLGLIVTALYLIAWRYGASGDMQLIWGAGFPSGSYPLFLSAQLGDMWRASFSTFVLPRLSTVALLAVAICFAYILLAKTWRNPTTREVLVFYAVFATTLCLINALRVWPLGDGRQNLFLFGHIIVFVFLIVAIAPLSRPLASILVILLIVIAIRHAVSPDYGRTLADRLRNGGAPTERSDLVFQDFSNGGAIGRRIAVECTAHPALVIEEQFMTALKYYSDYDPHHHDVVSMLRDKCATIVSYGEPYRSQIQAERQFRALLADAPDAWFIYTHLSPPEVTAFVRAAGRLGRVEQIKSYQGAGYFHLVRHSYSPQTF